MNAADVTGAVPRPEMSDGATSKIVAALLAHGEQGVAILPDGTLWALQRAVLSANMMRMETDGYKLVPLSAVAGDTDA